MNNAAICLAGNVYINCNVFSILNFKEYRYLIKGIIIVLRELILFLKIGDFKPFENELFELRKSKTLSTTRQYSTVAST